MNLLKRQYSFIWLILSLITCNTSSLFLGALLNIYEKNAWYTKWYYWTLGILFGILPGIIMLFIFILETNVKIAQKFNVAGEEIYKYPYIWLASLIIPVVGWAIFIILILYIYIWNIICLFQGKGEKYINN